MSSKPDVARIIKEQRNRLSLSLHQLSRLSGVSVAHLGRIEQGQRGASTRTLQKISKPLGLDLNELLVMAGHLLPEPLMLPEEETDKLRAELHTLLERVAIDSRRIKEITDRLSMKS